MSCSWYDSPSPPSSFVLGSNQWNLFLYFRMTLIYPWCYTRSNPALVSSVATHTSSLEFNSFVHVWTGGHKSMFWNKCGLVACNFISIIMDILVCCCYWSFTACIYFMYIKPSFESVGAIDEESGMKWQRRGGIGKREYLKNGRWAMPRYKNINSPIRRFEAGLILNHNEAVCLKASYLPLILISACLLSKISWPQSKTLLQNPQNFRQAL